MDLNYDFVIVPKEYQRKFLKEQESISKLSSFTMLTLQEFVKKVTYDFSLEAVFYLMKKYGLKREVAEIVIRNTYYVEEKKYQTEKLNFLVQVKKEIQPFLTYHPTFLTYLRTHRGGIFGYECLDAYEESLLKKYSVEKIELPRKTMENIPYYEFSTMEEELAFVASEIRNLHERGIPYSKILLSNISSEYDGELEKIFDFFHIPYEKKEQDPIYGTLMAHFVLEHLKEKDLLKRMENEFPFEKERNLEVFKQILKILNSYAWASDFEEVRECIQYDFMHTYLEEEKKEEAVHFVSYETYPFDEEYVFFLGCNQGSFPQLYKDEDYLSDAIKKEIVLSNTVEKNKKALLSTKKIVTSISHMILSAKRKSSFDTYLPSSLLRELPIEKKEIVDSNIHYSKLYDQILFTKYLDDYRKYGTKKEDFEIWKKTFPKLSYQTYQNDFTGITKQQLEARLKGNLRLSYTALDNYKRCGFRYYVSRILKCDAFEENFTIFIGNLFHEVLKRAFQKNFDFEEVFQDFSEERECNAKERFFLKKLKEELRFDIEVIQKQNQLIGLKEAFYEEPIEVSFSYEIPVTFHGILDKVYYGENLSAIVDYKTGSLPTDFGNLAYGIHMQLPIYYYLLKRHPKLQTTNVVGFYLQKIVNPEINIPEKGTRLEERKKLLRLNGYSTNRESDLEKFDPTYKESSLIKGMRVGENGFYANSKVLSPSSMDALEHLVEKQIQSGIEDILSLDFSIHPKVIGKEEVGCENCPYFDLCFKKESDKVYLKEYHKMEFLESEV